jgi:phosphatidylinositol alpha-1,6-mannosyltransferase
MPTQRAPQRVVFLLTEVLAKGGIQRFNQTILDACRNIGVDCRVLSLHDSIASERSDAGSGQISVEGFAGNRSAFSLAVARTLLTDRYDRVFIGHINFLTLAIGILAMRPFHRAQIMLAAHGIEVWNGLGRARRRALARVHQILCVSRYTRERILEQAPALAADRLLIFPNAFAESWGNILPSAVGHPLPPRFILSVTRLDRGDRYKGIATVIEALGMLSDDSVHYLIVGRGSDRDFLQLIARRCGVEARVHFLGGLADSALVGLYKTCIAFVLPSGKEGFGIVFLEAMFFGAPVIAAREKGALDVVKDGETGLMVSFGNSMEIRHAIERIAADNTLRDRLCTNGKRTVSDDGLFTFANFTGRCREVFELDRP